MDRIPTEDPMESPLQHPLAGLDPVDLLKQGVAEDTIIDEATSPFNPPTVDDGPRNSFRQCDGWNNRRNKFRGPC